jgi:hypothetical protein
VTFSDAQTREVEFNSMEHKRRNFLSSCAKTDFGRIAFSATEKAFYKRFNDEMISFCRSLPESVQTDSLLSFLEYSGLTLGDELDFFAHYYPPSWSILYWLCRYRAYPASRFKKRDVTSAIEAQSMAMFLHSLDDHLTDNQLSVSPLTLLLRSQAWTIMNRAFCNLAEDLPRGGGTVRRFIAEYYSSIQDTKGLDSLNSYCDLFRGQMGIGMIAPTLLSMKMARRSDFTRDIQIAYGSFGIAWRLLDDIKDIEADMEKGVHSAIYLCLPEESKTHWNIYTTRDRAAARAAKRNILIHILEHGVIDKVRERICAELDTAASMVDAYGLTGLAQEFRCLAQPIRNSGGP